VWEDVAGVDGIEHLTGRKKKRLCLVLDCLIPHEFSNKNSDLINLQHHVIKEKKLAEKEAIVIFNEIVKTVEALHKVSPDTRSSFKGRG
jgi:serine/threonine-protein kinase 40